MANVVACRTWEYRDLVAEAGLKHIEYPAPLTRENVETVREGLDECGLSLSTVTLSMDVGSDEGLAGVGDALALLAGENVEVAFTSVRAGEADLEGVYARLRRVGDLAQQNGVMVALETHPDLVLNGDVGRETMEAVDHHRIGINFDTANVHYYNRGVSSRGELKKVLPHVFSVHLKDTTGGFQEADFPPLGEGIVDFEAVFDLLDRGGFTGPLTLEIEGQHVGADSRRGRREAFARFLERSLDHLRGLDRL